MKKLFFLLMPFVMACSQSKIDTAKANIEKDIKENMGNPKSYEFVAIDSLTNMTEVDSLLKKQQDLIRNIKTIMVVKDAVEANYTKQLYSLADGYPVDLKAHNETKINYENLTQSVKRYTNKMDSISKILDDSLQYSKIEKKVIGYKTIFTYRATNENGAVVIMKKNVELDKNLNLFN